MPFCSGKSKPPTSINEDGITSAASSSNESNVSQEQHWKCLKKKPKELSDKHSEFTDLDSISIDIAIFVDGAAGLTMPLIELVNQDISSDVFGDDMCEHCITSLNPPSVAKNPHLPLDEVKVESSKILKELEKGVSLILKGLRSPTSKKITRDSHQEFLSSTKQRLHTVNEEKIKVDKHLGELQKSSQELKKS
ncbi:hypothetical protein HAX54_006031 [Datura stramonium]|uniref:Uncharacterized protein n=1 Tax=Datura stramonium TaxID=4076 RepID=A0ABS8RUM3_DATST|nr:hypothetical protein [Datura stramonium]